MRNAIDTIVGLTNAHDFSYKAFLSIIKILILSQVERTYLTQIEQELDRSQDLDHKIVDMNSKINQEKQKKLEKSKKLYTDPKDPQKRSKGPQTVENLLEEIRRLENQLEKAN